MLVLLCCVLLLPPALAAPDARKVFEVRTRRISSRAEMLKQEHREEDINSPLDSKSASSMPLTAYYDSFYVGDIQLGTPPQTFSVQMDTGEQNELIIDAQCDTLYCRGQSGYSKHRFNTSASSTFENSTDPFRFGSTKGTAGYDVMAVAGMSWTSQGLLVATQISEEFGKAPIDGVLGLSIVPENSRTVLSPLQNISSQLDQPLFTVFVTRHQQSLKAEAMDGGRITFGGLDNDNCDNTINYVPLQTENYWQIKMDDFSIGKFQAHRSYSKVILSSGTSSIGVPPDAMNGILGQLGLGGYDSRYLTKLPCNGKYPDMVFKIGGIDYHIPPFEYILDLGLSPPGTCALAITAAVQDGLNDKAQTFVLGDVFYRQYCVVHDLGNKRVGLARSSNIDTNTGSTESSTIFALVAAALVAFIVA